MFPMPNTYHPSVRLLDVDIMWRALHRNNRYLRTVRIDSVLTATEEPIDPTALVPVKTIMWERVKVAAPMPYVGEPQHYAWEGWANNNRYVMGPASRVCTYAYLYWKMTTDEDTHWSSSPNSGLM